MKEYVGVETRYLTAGVGRSLWRVLEFRGTDGSTLDAPVGLWELGSHGEDCTGAGSPIGYGVARTVGTAGML